MSDPGNARGTGLVSVAGDVVTGLKAQPMLLMIVVLNLIGLLLAYFAVKSLLDAGNLRTDALLKLIEYCLQHKAAP